MKTKPTPVESMNNYSQELGVEFQNPTAQINKITYYSLKKQYGAEKVIDDTIHTMDGYMFCIFVLPN